MNEDAINMEIRKVLKKVGITSQREIEQAIRARNVTETGGSVESFVAEQDVIAVGRFEQPKDVARVIVRAKEHGNYVRIEDIAQVVDDYEDWNERSFVDGLPGIGIAVRKERIANELKVVERVKTVVAGILSIVISSLLGASG